MVKDGAGCSGAWVKCRVFLPLGNSTLVYFNSADCAVEAARVVKADGVPGAGKFSIGEYRCIALAIDTETLQVSKRKNRVCSNVEHLL
jgi:hypothetical protein